MTDERWNKTRRHRNIKLDLTPTPPAWILPSMRTFIKILIVQCLTAGGLVVASSQGVLGKIYEADVSKLSVVILILFGFFCLYNLFVALDNKCDAIKAKRLSISQFMAPKMTAIGMLGTVVGFIIMMSAALDGAEDDTAAAIGAIKNGMATALYTTACGIVANVLLSVQNFMISYDLRD